MNGASIPTSASIRLPDWIIHRDLPSMLEDDASAMRLAIDLARENVARAHGGPFGAVLKDTASGRLVSVGVNLVQPSHNPVLHAETTAIALAAAGVGGSGGMTLYATCEPCIMCLGAIHWAGIRRVVYAALREDAEAIGFSEGAGSPELKAQMAARGVVFEAGMMREESIVILRGYRRSGGAIYGPPLDGAS
jgi:tRNA(Arg) A34 adenosine deaminase TadA